MDTNALIQKHLQLVIEANKTTNLTRIDSVETGQLLHIEDSLAGLPEVLAAPEGPAADLGTGGGFPGIPLAISANRLFMLVESVGKKVAVLDSIISELEVSELVSTYCGRIEELALVKPNSFTLLTARALTALPSLLELASPLLALGGHLVAYKAGGCEEELVAAQAVEDKLGMKHLSSRDFVLSDNEIARCILVFEKVAEPQVKLPRRPGMAQKRPYK